MVTLNIGKYTPYIDLMGSTRIQQTPQNRLEEMKKRQLRLQLKRGPIYFIIPASFSRFHWKIARTNRGHGTFVEDVVLGRTGQFDP